MTTAEPDPVLQEAQQRAFEDAAARRLVRRVLQQWPLIVACALIAAVAAFVASSSRTEIFEGTAKVRLDSVDVVSAAVSDLASISGIDPERQTATNAELLQLDVVRDRTSALIGGRIAPEDLKTATTVTSSPDTDLVTIVVQNEDPRLAADAANATVEAFVASRKRASRAQLRVAIERLQRQFDSFTPGEQAGTRGQQLQAGIRRLGDIGLLTTGGVTFEQQARAAENPVSPKPRRDAILGFIAGGLLGLGVALLRARLDDRIRDADELDELWSLPVVGLVPETDDLDGVGRELPVPAVVEAFALARTNLRYLHVGGDVKSVLVTSALEGEGKSTVAWNLAVAAAMAESRVLLIEGDLRRPVLATRLGLATRNGFSEVLAGLAEPKAAIESVVIGDAARGVEATVDVLPAGLVPPSPVALLERPVAGEVIAVLAAEYDIVIVDTPPATVVADALVMLEHVDGAIVVSRLGRVTRGAYRRLRDQIAQGDTPVVGQVVNGGATAKQYGYESYYQQVPATAGSARGAAGGAGAKGAKGAAGVDPGGSGPRLNGASTGSPAGDDAPPVTSTNG